MVGLARMCMTAVPTVARMVARMVARRVPPMVGPARICMTAVRMVARMVARRVPPMVGPARMCMTAVPTVAPRARQLTVDPDMIAGSTDGGAETSCPAAPGLGRILQRLVSVSTETFANSYWSTHPLVSRATATGSDFSQLFSAAAVDELVSRRGLRTPFVRMARQGEVLTASTFTRSGGTGAGIADQVADDKVLGLLADGATLVLQGLHRTWPPLIEFGSTLSGELGHPVQINAYVTPPQNRGFAPHYDTHDVFVVQVSGGKRWLIHEPVLVDPLPNQTSEQRREAVSARACEPALMDVTLKPDDVLYLPRGFLHSASALGETSIHLTIGVHPITRHTLARELLRCAGELPELRKSLPMGVDLSDPQVLAGQLRTTADLLTATASVDPRRIEEIAGRVGAELARSTRPMPISPLTQVEALARVTRDTPLRLRSGLRVSSRRTGGSLVLKWLDKQVTLPVSNEPAVRFVLNAEPLAARDLPGLDQDEQLDLVRRLLREAIVVPISGE